MTCGACSALVFDMHRSRETQTMRNGERRLLLGVAQKANRIFDCVPPFSSAQARLSRRTIVFALEKGFYGARHDEVEISGGRLTVGDAAW